MSVLRLATRRSPLALLQANFVRDQLLAAGYDAELVLIETKGDQRTDVPLKTLGGQGVFAVEIQRALLDGRADVAVHSAKDLPSTSPLGLQISSVPQRKSVTDVLVGRSLAGLGPGATVATGSPRRKALLLERRPDLTIVELRGNMATRLSTPGTGGVDAIVAARAALERLGEEHVIAEELDPTWFTPQVGQGALALETRVDDTATIDMVAALSDPQAARTLEAERSFLRELGAGCSIPAGAYATVQGDEVTLHGLMIGADGSRSVRESLTGRDPVTVGRDVARELRDVQGGATLSGWSS